MVSLDEIRDQLRDELVVLKAAMVDWVPAAEVFFVRDEQGFAHVRSYCTTIYQVPSGAPWEAVKGRDLPNLTLSCSCVRRSPDELKRDVERMESVLNSQEPRDDLLWSDRYLPLFSTFPAAFEAWDRVYRLYFRLVVADANFLEIRADFRGVLVSRLPSVSVCTVQYKYPAELEVLPNGVSAVVPWGMLPEVAAIDLWGSPDRYALLDVEGWPVERVEVVSTLLRDAGSRGEAFAAFKLAEQLVP